MENFKELERRIKVALDRIGEGLENENHADNAGPTEEALHAEISVLSEQNAKLSSLLAELELVRKAEAEELQLLYNKLANVLST